MSVDELEQLRKKTLRIFFLILVGVIAVGIVVAGATSNITFFLIAFMLAIVLAFIVSAKSKQKFTDEYKKVFVKRSLEDTFDNLIYEPNTGIDYETVSNTGLIHMGDRFSSEDYISGEYKGIHVVASDIHIEDEEVRTDSDGNTHTEYTTVFRGKWLIFDFNKNFISNVKLIPKSWVNLGAKKSFYGRSGNKVKMEDESFNKIFTVYADDQTEAFYILTPHMMEKLKAIAEEFKKRIFFAFEDNKLHVAVNNNKDAFEHSLLKKIDEQKEIETISSDIRQITDFVDGLNLDNTLFKI